MTDTFVDLRPLARPHVTLREFNRLSRSQATDLLRPCLGVERWSTALVACRPYLGLDDLLEVARDAALPLDRAELAAAFTHRVGSSRRRVAEQILEGSELYQGRFGRPFLIREAGRSLEEILSKLHLRLLNDPDTEDRAVAHELRQIALLCLTSAVTP